MRDSLRLKVKLRSQEGRKAERLKVKLRSGSKVTSDKTKGDGSVRGIICTEVLRLHSLCQYSISTFDLMRS